MIALSKLLPTHSPPRISTPLGFTSLVWGPKNFKLSAGREGGRTFLFYWGAYKPKKFNWTSISLWGRGVPKLAICFKGGEGMWKGLAGFGRFQGTAVLNLNPCCRWVVLWLVFDKNLQSFFLELVRRIRLLRGEISHKECVDKEQVFFCHQKLKVKKR